MSTARRFQGTAVAAGLLVLLGGGAWLAGVWEADVPPVSETLDALFRFEKEDMVGFRIVRPDTTIEMRRDGEEWTAVGETWRPNSSMVRRVAHQLHDLTARAAPIPAPEDYARYGLGEGAIAVTIFLRDGSELAFQAGDPNPTSVSYYLRPLPGDRVYIVKKSAVDFYRSDLEQYREDKFATFDANAVDTLTATVAGRALAFDRTGQYTWHMSAPVDQKASRDKVRMMLGRISAMKAMAFVADGASDLSVFGLDPPIATMAVGLSSGDRVTMWIGHPIPGTDPALRYVYRVEDDAVYAVKDGIIEAYSLPVEDFRDRILLGKHEWDVTAMEVTLDRASLAVARTADGWRWPEGAAIPGSTPKRVAGRAADVRALAFHDAIPEGAGLAYPFATVQLQFDDDTAATVILGTRFEVPGPERPERPEQRQYAKIGDDPVVYEIDGQLGSVIEDLHREYARKAKRDGERHLDLQPEPQGGDGAP